MHLTNESIVVSPEAYVLFYQRRKSPTESIEYPLPVMTDSTVEATATETAMTAIPLPSTSAAMAASGSAAVGGVRSGRSVVQEEESDSDGEEMYLAPLGSDDAAAAADIPASATHLMDHRMGGAAAEEMIDYPSASIVEDLGGISGISGQYGNTGPGLNLSEVHGGGLKTSGMFVQEEGEQSGGSLEVQVEEEEGLWNTAGEVPYTDMDAVD